MKHLIVLASIAAMAGSALTAAGLPAQASPLPTVACTHNYQHTVNTNFPNWSQVQWTANSCRYYFRGVSQCYGGKPVHHVIRVGGFVVSATPSRATCPSGEPYINRAGYDIELSGGGYNRIWYWP